LQGEVVHQVQFHQELQKLHGGGGAQAAQGVEDGEPVFRFRDVLALHETSSKRKPPIGWEAE